MKKTTKTVADVNEYSAAKFLNFATKSGVALKVSTVKAMGEYPITFKGTGTGIVTSIIYSVLAKNYGDKVSTTDFASGFANLEKDTPVSRLMNKLLPAGYANYKTLKNRIIAEIRKGAIIAFSPAPDADGNKFFADIKSAK